MDNIMEIAIDLSPQKHIWTTPFWLRIRPTGPADLWHEIYEHQFHDWNTLLSMVDKYRKYLIEDPNRPFSWEECEAPEVLPRTLVDTTIQELVRLLPSPFVASLWLLGATTSGNSLPPSPTFLEKTPVFLWGKLPCHDSLVFLLKLDYPKTQYFQWTPHQTIYTFVHNCPGVSLRGILTDGVIRPSSWKATGLGLLSQPGLLLSLLLSGSQPHLRQTDQSGHYTSADSRTPVRPSCGMWIWRSLLHPPVLCGWRVLLPPVPALRCAHRRTSL